MSEARHIPMGVTPSSKAWRKAGFFTLFRDARHGFHEPVVILVRKSDGEARYMPTRGGKWLEDWNRSFSNFSSGAELTGEDLDGLRFCYCDEACEVCDFCAARRSPPIGWTTTKWAKPLPWT